MDLRILAALLAFLKEMIVDNDKVKLFAKKERNEFTLLLALAFIFGSFFWYYAQADRLWYINRELTMRLKHQSTFVETLTIDRDNRLKEITMSCQERADSMVKIIYDKDTRITILEERRTYLSNELMDTLKRCK